MSDLHLHFSQLHNTSHVIYMTEKQTNVSTNERQTLRVGSAMTTCSLCVLFSLLRTLYLLHIFAFSLSPIPSIHILFPGTVPITSSPWKHSLSCHFESVCVRIHFVYRYMSYVRIALPHFSAVPLKLIRLTECCCVSCSKLLLVVRQYFIQTTTLRPSPT